MERYRATSKQREVIKLAIKFIFSEDRLQMTLTLIQIIPRIYLLGVKNLWKVLGWDI